MGLFKKVLAYPLSILFYTFFFFIALFTILTVRIGFLLAGYKGVKTACALFSWLVICDLKILGTRLEVKREAEIPFNAPILFISNHQSMWEVVFFFLFLFKHDPRFAAKVEMYKGYPIYSYYLRKGKCLFVDRRNRQASFQAIEDYTKFLNNTKSCLVYFPEGKLSKSNEVLPFKRGGLSILLNNLSDGYVVPIQIHNFFKLQVKGFDPLPLGESLSIRVGKPIAINAYSNKDDLINYIEDFIKM